MSEHYKIETEEKEPSFLILSEPSVSFRSNFSGAVYVFYEVEELVTSIILKPECLTTVIELKDSEVDEILEPKSLLIEVLKEKGMEEPNADEMQQLLFKYVDKRTRERHLKLTDDQKKAISNLMVLVAKKLEEEI